jgi:hypothetical protein
MGNREKENRPMNLAKQVNITHGYRKKIPVALAPSVSITHNKNRTNSHNPPNKNKFEPEDQHLCRNLLK